MLWSRKRKGSTPLAGLRDALFADASLGEVASRATSPSDDPWSHFAAAQQALSKGDKIGAIQELRRVEEMEGLETRLYLQAWHCLRTLGELPPETIAREVKGVVVEVGLDGSTGRAGRPAGPVRPAPDAHWSKALLTSGIESAKAPGARTGSAMRPGRKSGVGRPTLVLQR